MKRILLVLLLFSLLLVFSGCSSNREKHDELSDRYPYQEEIRYVDDTYPKIIRSTEDYMSVLYEYFEERSVSFDEAYNAYDKLSSILYPLY